MSDKDKDLDDKLRKVWLEPEGCELGSVADQKALDDIKQVFDAEGYRNRAPSRETEDKYVKEHTAHVIRVLKEKGGIMTGQEWFERFDDELRKLVSRGDGETWMGWGCDEVRGAAKKAAGI